MEEAYDIMYKYKDFSLLGYLCILCVVAMITYFIFYRVYDTNRRRNMGNRLRHIDESTMKEEVQEEPKEKENEREETSGFDDIWSPFERLPRELVFEIFDYVPESVHNLKLTSRLLRNRVDDYARQDRIQLVKEMGFTETGWSSAKDISVHVPRNMSDLFEIRLKSRKTDQTGLAIQVKRSFHSECIHTQTDPVIYKLRYKVYEWRVIVDQKFPLEKWLGKNLGKVTLFNCDGSILDSVIDQLADFEIRSLEITQSLLSKKDFDSIFNVVQTHKIEHLSLCVGRVANFDQEGALIDLSSHVRILYLGKRSDGQHDELFNIHPSQWARIGLEMFSRKLDTLCLHNRLFPRYISAECLTTLSQKLPRIGKKAWFQATGDNDVSTNVLSLSTHIYNEHVIKYICDRGHLSVGVKHKSRLREIYSLHENEWDLKYWTVHEDHHFRRNLP